MVDQFRAVKITFLAVLTLVFILLLTVFGYKRELLGADTSDTGTTVYNGADAVLDTASAANRATYTTTGYRIFFDLNGTEAYVAGISSLDGLKYNVNIPAAINVREADGTTGVYAVTAINNNAFENYRQVDILTLPDTVTVIGNEAFRYCINMSQVVMTNYLTSIGSEAFFGCSSLQGSSDPQNVFHVGTFVIPYGVSQIGSGAFGNCPKITAFQVSNNPYYCNIDQDGILYSTEAEDSYRLVACPSGYIKTTELSISNKVFAIDTEAFYGCTKLTKITIPDSVKTIRERAFYGCTSLSVVVMPKYATIMGDDILGGCSALKTVVIYNTDTGNVYSYCTAYNYPTEVHCTVEFYDGGTLLSTQDVIYGQAAKAPNVNPKQNYALSWDVDFSKITTNTVVHAVWLQNLRVTFQDKENGWVSEVYAHYGQAVNPPAWTRAGYTLAWDTDAYLYVTKELTINAVWLQSMTSGSVTTGTSDGTYKVGDSFTIGDLTYKVTKMADSNNRVSVISCRDKTLEYVKIPSRITAGGTVFKVTNIAARVFKNMTDLKKAVIGSNMLKINTAAFYGCSNLQTIVIYSTHLTSDNIAEKSFKNVSSSVKVKVPSGYAAKYKVRLRDGGLPSTAKVVAM